MSAKVKAPSKSRKEIREAERRPKQLRARVTWILVGAAVLIGGGYGIGSAIWNEIRPKPGQSVPELSREHIQPGAPHEAYNTDPPTSGPHYAQPARAGFYDNALADETLVHNLEHGYIIIWYKCTGPDEAQCQTVKTQIRDAMDRAGSVKLIAVPRPDMDSLIALTSWGRIYKSNNFNEAEISDFANFFRGRAPEGNAP